MYLKQQILIKSTHQTLKINIASDKNISKGGALYLVFLVIVVVIALYTYNVYPVAFDRTRR